MASSVPIVRERQVGFRGLKVELDTLDTDTRADRVLRTPFIRSDLLPPGVDSSVGGGLAYDVLTERPYYSDGFTWFPVGAGVPGTVMSYSQIKDGVQIIPRNIPTILSNWEVTSSSTYHTIPGWNLTTGVYTAEQRQIITIRADIAWAGGISNLGNRTLRIMYYDIMSATTSMVKEAVTQADPNLKVDTTQEAGIHLSVNAGDQIFVEVEHDAPIPLTVCGGDCTSLAGFRVQVV